MNKSKNLNKLELSWIKITTDWAAPIKIWCCRSMIHRKKLARAVLGLKESGRADSVSVVTRAVWPNTPEFSMEKFHAIRTGQGKA